MTRNIFTADHNGFSLLEMTCVLIVISILASCAIPALTRSFLDKAGEKVSLDISAIEDGARAYFITNGSWPASINALQSENYLPSSWNALNPFGNPYITSISGSVFSVSTQVINGSQIAITNRLPVSSYSGITVSSSVPPPGASSTGFGSRSSVSVGKIYLAATDGIVEVMATISTPGGGTRVSGFTDSSSSPTTFSGALSVNFPGSGQSDHTTPQSGFCMSVKKGDYYLLTRSAIVNSGATSDTASVSAIFTPLGV
jgi:prepilin-type N-terminal cleavage/methylation domain-containing protein